MPREWRVPIAFAVLILSGLVYSAAHAWFWERAHDVAWLAAPLSVLLVVLLLRRSRVAWWIFVSIFAMGLVTDLAHLPSGHASVGWILGACVGVIELGLLVSPAMRQFVRFRGTLAPRPS
jgi:hypothetical protein